jgi:hypothetical protein
MYKKLICLASFVLVLGLVLPSVADGELLGWWKLDEGSGTVANDSSGKGNHGAINNPSGGLGPGGSVWDTDPDLGVVLSFNGDETAGAYVDAGMIIPAMTLTNDFTWAFWAKQTGDGTGVNMTILGNRYGASDQLQFSKFTPTNFEYYNNGNNSGFIPYTIPADVWIHHAVVKRGASLTRYLNGVVSGSSTINTTLVAQPFYMGGDAASERWSGRLSNVRIYNHALSPSEIKTLATLEWATKANPKDKGSVTSQTVPLTWTPGGFADQHKVYFSDNFDSVNGLDPAALKCETTGDDTRCFVGMPPDPLLVRGTTYYWRVVEVNDNPGAPAGSPWVGPVWSFMVTPEKAWLPDPADGARFVLIEPTFYWNKGGDSGGSEVYFGTAPGALTRATGGFIMHQEDHHGRCLELYNSAVCTRY